MYSSFRFPDSYIQYEYKCKDRVLGAVDEQFRLYRYTLKIRKA
jgi:hypothetical protein